MSARRVVVTGLGATTPLGGDVTTSWSALLAGTSGVRLLTEDWAQNIPVHFARQASVCKYLVPPGYPDRFVRGGVLDVSGVDHKETLYMGSLEAQQAKLIMQGSRALAVLCMAENLHKAETAAEKIISEIQGVFCYRTDIGKQ